MNESEEGTDKSRVPAQQTHQTQLVQSVENEGQAVQAGSSREEIDSAKKTGLPETLIEEVSAFDNARFTAGVVSFYEALLKEPVPEKMLRLIDEIAKQERKS